MNEINADQDVVRGLGAWGCPAKRGRTAQPPAFRKGERCYGTLFDGILMDVSMPVVDGIEAGGIDYLVKPYALPELLAKLRMLVRLSRQDRAALSGERHRALLEVAGGTAHELAQPLTTPSSTTAWSRPPPSCSTSRT